MRIRRVLLLSVAFGSTLCCASVTRAQSKATGADQSSPAPAQSGPTQLLLQKARSLEQRGRIDLAAKVWQQVLLADAKNAEALEGLARYKQQSEGAPAGGDTSNAQRPGNSAARSQPSNVRRGPDSLQRAKLSEAASLSAQHNPDAAMKLYKEVFGENPPKGDWSIAYYETLAATADGAPTAIGALRDLAKKYPDDVRYSISLAKLLTYNPHTRAEGVKILESIPSNSPEASAVRDAWRQALVWEHGNLSYEASLHDYQSRYPDPTISEEFGVVQATRSAMEEAIGRDEQTAYQALSDNNLVRAEELFEKLRSNPASATAGLVGIGYVRMKEQNFAAAVEAFEGAKLRLNAPNPNLDRALTTSRFWRQMQEATKDLDQDHVDAALAGFQKALQIQPNSPEALGGEAGTLMKQGQPGTAVAVFQQWTKVSPEDSKAWLGLVRASQQSGDSAGAIDAAKQMPAKVRAASLDDPQFLLPLSEAYRATGNIEESQQLLEQALQNAGRAKASSDARAEIAAALSQAGSYEQATEIFVNVLQQDPQKLDAWEGLIGTLHQQNKDAEALDVGAKMPEDLYEKALQKSDFVVLMSAIYESQDQLQPAQRLLEQAMQDATSQGQTAPVQLQLQIAGLWLREKQYGKALDLFGQVLDRYPENLDAWRGELAVYHETYQDGRAIQLVERASDLQRRRLESDPDILSLLAFAHSAQGDHDLALRLVRQAISRYQTAQRPLPVELQLQASWIFLDAGDGQSLYAQLRELTARTDLTVTQRNTLTDLWTAWTLKKADALATAGNFRQALTLLTSARRAFPDNSSVRSAYAGTLVRAGYARQGLDEFRAWNFAGARPDDYVAAVGAAMSAHELKLADAWLAASMRQWPNDPKLLMEAAKLAEAKGDYGRAQRYYQQALAATPTAGGNAAPVFTSPISENVDAPAALRHLASQLASDNSPNSAAPGGPPSPDHADALDAFLSGLPPAAAEQTVAPAVASGSPNNNLTFPTSPAHPALEDFSKAPVAAVAPVSLPASPKPPTETGDPLQSLLPPSASRGNQAQMDSASLNAASQTDGPGAKPSFVDPSLVRQLMSDDAAETSAPQPAPLPVPQAFVETSSPNPPAASPKQQEDFTSPRDQLQDQIAGMGSELSPYAGAEGILHGRSGQSGFDKLLSQQVNIEGSTTLGQAVRMTFIVEPVVLDAGSPTSQASDQLGTLAAGASFGPLGASGVGGEVQLATQNFGARLGITPQGFLVRNFIGSLEYRPGGGPLKIVANRTPVTETLLSYAGIRDPGTGQVWGGVISTGGSALLSLGSASAGFYAGGGYQHITGQTVETNQSYSGTVGSYWKLFTKPYGSLTIGLNFSGMHYDENLRYFTLGQGGYFSPQSYLLFNIPIHWGGTYEDRFEYSVDASIGSQHFQEDATPYYPLGGPTQSSSTGNGLFLGSAPAPTVPYYSGQISTGANYSMVFKGAYHLTENWVLGGFLDLNNTQNYASRTAGIYMRYQFRPSRIIPKDFTGYLPDWNAIQPLAQK